MSGDLWLTYGAVYIVVWWLLLLMVLPWGVRPPDRPEPGHADSAPEKPHIGRKFLITTGLAAVVTPAVVWVVNQGLDLLRPL
jgi:predicted secreted protein